MLIYSLKFVQLLIKHQKKPKHRKYFFMRNDFYFCFKITAEQVAYARKLVEYSIQNHTVPNIWDSTEKAKKNTADLRLTGTLGEVVFADTYGLKRPARAFGASDGQDWGKDFQLILDNKVYNFDVKTMRRNGNTFYADYVLNIPASQLKKPESLTDFYFHVNIHPKTGKDTDFIASFVGYVNKEEIKQGKVGKFYPAGTLRTRADGTQFPFHEDTYEVALTDLSTPPLNEKIRQLPDFRIKHIKSCR